MLTSTALIETGDLTQWYRFQNPGHFRVSLRCNWISHVGATGKQPIWLQSNEVELEIVARDAASDAASLASILHEIDAAKDYSTRTRALHRLDLAQSSAATSQKIRRYLAAASGGFSEYTGMLQHASDVDAIIPVLETALTDLQKAPPRGIADLLACLQTRKLGVPADNPAREALTRRYFEKYVNLFLATLPSRSGSERAPALFEAWLETLRIRQRPPDLEAEVLGVFPQLDADQQFEFLSTDWVERHQPHDRLLPLVQKIATTSNVYAGQAFPLWCKAAPGDCRKAIIADAIEPVPAVSCATILLIPEAEHPELDAVLRHKLRESMLAQPMSGGMQIAALVMRTGSRRIRPDVDAFLDADHAGNTQIGLVEGYLLGYLMRAAPGEAKQRLVSALSDTGSDYRAGMILSGLANAGKAAAATPIVEAALSNPNLETARAAALFLSAHAPASFRPALVSRLDALRSEWLGREGELQVASPSNARAWEAAQLEQGLVSALVNARVLEVIGQRARPTGSGLYDRPM